MKLKNLRCGSATSVGHAVDGGVVIMRRSLRSSVTTLPCSADADADAGTDTDAMQMQMQVQIQMRCYLNCYLNVKV